METRSASLPAVSAVVLNFNGGRMVLDCLASLQTQSMPLIEIVCVDNASRDGSARQVEQRFPEVRLLRLPENVGYAAGMNRGIEATRGECTLLLNLDVTLDPQYAHDCAAALGSDPGLGGVTGKLFRPGSHDPAIIDTTGHVVYRNRRAVDRGEGEPDEGQYDKDLELFSVCGAAPCYRRSMLEDIKLDGQYFDEEFFAYFEDFDLSWRARLRGWRFGFVPGATGRHHRGGTGSKASTFILACNHRNRLLVMLRNDHPASFLRHLPGIAYTELRATLHMLGLRPRALALAWAQAARLAPRQWANRRLIQQSRKVGWRELEPCFEPYDYGLRAMISRARRRAALR